MKKTKIQNDQKFMLRDEEYNYGVMPSKRTEMWREIELEGNIKINGGIFGKSLEIDPAFIFVRDAVFVLNHIKINGGKSGTIWFNSVVNSEHSILLENNNIYSRFRADLRTLHLNITNAFIYGNVYCKNAIIKNSVVLGTVFTDNDLTLHNSIVGSFHTHNLKINGKIGLIFPFGITSVLSEIEAEIYYMLLSPITNDDFGVNVIPFFQDDIYKIKAFNDDNIHHIIFPNMRIFDFRSYSEQVLMNINRFFNLCESSGKNIEEIDKKLSRFEIPFLKLISSNFTIKEVKGKSKFMEIPDSLIGNLITESSDNIQLSLQELKGDPKITEKAITPAQQDTKSSNEKEELLENSENSKSIVQESTDGIYQEENDNKEEKEDKVVEMKCPNCGHQIDNPEYIYCEACGAKLKE